MPVTFPILFDRENKVSARYSVEAMPSTVLIDRKGNVRHCTAATRPATRPLRRSDPRAGQGVGSCACVTLCLCALLVASLSGCGSVEPWVKPYERQNFADPIMAFDRDPVSSAYIDHVFEAREGARGALGSPGGGCGCN